MTRSEYLETIEGQYNERQKRKMRILYLDIKQEPKSKKGISKQEKLFFRQEVKRQLKAMRRRPYVGDIILEIDYFTTQNNPPMLHNLSKNYLDLLHKPMPDIDSYKGILFKDDSQIKILISHYHLDEFKTQKPHIRISSYSLSDFYKDIELADKILNNNFTFLECGLNSELRNYYEQEIELDDDFGLFDELKELENNRNFWINNFGENIFYSTKQYLKRKLQERYLKINKLELFELITLLESKLSLHKKYANDMRFKEIWESLNFSRNLILLESNFLELGNAPSKKGETTIFKENLKNKLKHFKRKHKILFPLLQPISVIILFIPPKHNVIDLDNLALYIVPFVNDILNPPASFLFSYNKKQLNKLLNKEAKLAQRFYPSSITSYQLIHLPREINDPDNGDIKFIITDDLYNKSSVWKIINNFIEKWEELINR